MWGIFQLIIVQLLTFVLLTSISFEYGFMNVAIKC